MTNDEIKQLVFLNVYKKWFLLILFLIDGQCNAHSRKQLYQKFFASIVAGDAKKVRKFVRQGIDVNAYEEEKNKLAPLHEAAIWNHTHVAKELLKAENVEVDIRDSKNFTPLMFASKWENEEMIKDLVAARANVDAQNYLGQTALHLVVLNEKRSWRVLADGEIPGERGVEALIAAGARIGIKDSSGQIAYNLASENLKKIIKIHVLYREKCSICLENYMYNKHAVIFECKHVFHSECIEQWFSKKRCLICPLCRQKSHVLFVEYIFF